MRVCGRHLLLERHAREPKVLGLGLALGHLGITQGCRHHHIGLQPPSHRVAASIWVICPTFCLRDMPESRRNTSSSKPNASGGAGGGGACRRRLRDEVLVPEAARAAGSQTRAAARRPGSIGLSARAFRMSGGEISQGMQRGCRRDALSHSRSEDVWELRCFDPRNMFGSVSFRISPPPPRAKRR